MDTKKSRECQITIDALSCDNSVVVEPDQPKDSIAQFYIKERKKVNIWTHLFKELSRSIDQIVRMCELEAKPEFCKGVKEVLKAGAKDLDKVEHKIKLEQGHGSPSCAWEVPVSGQNPEDVIRELKGNQIEGLFDEEELIEFNLLSELVSEGKMSFYDAIVLVIRERASISSEAEVRDSIRSSRNNALDKSSRASSTPLPITALISRVNLKLKAVDSNKKPITSEKLKEKLERAELNRSQLNEKRLEISGRHASKVERIKDEQSRQLNQKTETMLSKEKDVLKRRCEKIEDIKKKTQDYKMKASEVSFLILLEQQSRQRHLDTKLESTRKRRLKIVEKIKANLRENSNAEAVLNRKEELEIDKREMLKKRLDKLEEASRRRLEMLELKRAGIAKKTKKEPSASNSKVEPENYLVAELLEDKDRLDKKFENFQFEKLKRYNSEWVLSQSYDFDSGVAQHEISLDNSLINDDKDEAPAKKKGKRKKRKQKKTEENGDVKELKDNGLQNYYRFLTKDLEYVELRKRANKQIKPRTNPAPKPKFQINTQISELPELICREMAKKDKLDNKYNLCTLCNTVIDAQSIEEHLASKTHKKHRSSLKTVDEAQVIIVCDEQEMIAQRFNALKRKCKKVKHYIEVVCLKNETVFIKDAVSAPNKARLQKLSLELEKQVNSQKKDYEAISGIFGEVHKIIDKNNEQDYNVMRQIRFISTMIEFFKCSHFCLKFEFQGFVEILNEHFKILNKLCVLRDTRLYMILTNKIVPIIEILSWSWSHSYKAIEILDYIPQALHLLTFLFKQKVSEEHMGLKTNLAEYVFYCGFFTKVRQRFLAFNTSTDSNASTSKVSLLITKTLNFIEAITEICHNPSGYVLGDDVRLNDNLKFVLKETEFAGCLHLLATILLSKGQFHRNVDLLPQLCYSHAYFILRIFNNIARADVKLVQTFFSENSFNADQFYHVCLFLFDYCLNNFGKVREVIDILQELILLTGYFALLNPGNQALLSRGTVTHTLVYKLCKLPVKFYYSLPLFKELLLPTVIAVVHNNEANLRIFEDEGHLPLIAKYLQQKISFYMEAGDDPGHHDAYRASLQAAIEKNKELLNLSTVNPDFYMLNNRFPVSELKMVHEFVLKRNKSK